jgi:hypothetical protein
MAIDFFKIAHDSGDGETIYHCPFCGSGQVIARSDGTVECEFCHTAFTVQVQPEMPAFPQTINGMPVDVPGMPGSIGEDQGGQPLPADGPLPGAEDENLPPGVGDSESESPTDSGDSGEGDENPFGKKSSSLRTPNGAHLPREEFIRHLAVRFSDPDEREAVLRAIRESR